MFKKVDSKVDLVKLEEKVLKFWHEQKIFEKTLEKTKNGKPGSRPKKKKRIPYPNNRIHL